MSTRDWFWVVLLGTIWGTSFLFNDLLVAEVGPLWVSAGRVGIGALGSWAFFLAAGKRLPTEPYVYVLFLVIGVFGYALPFALFPLAQQHMSSGAAAIINAMTPIATVIVSHYWRGGEKATWNKSLGVVAGFSGIAILAAPGIEAGGAAQAWAVFAALGATFCYAVTLNLARSLAKIDPSTIAAAALTGATLAAVPLAWFAYGTPHITQLSSWFALVGSGLVATAFAFQIMYRLLPRIGATNFSVVTFIAPVSAIILGITILGETIHPTDVAGMLGIFIGLILIDGRLYRRLRPKPL